ALRFEGLDGVPCLLHSARHEPTDGMLLPAHGAHNLLQRGAILALKHLYNLSGLAALARPGAFLHGGILGAVRRFRGRAGLLPRLRLRGRALGYRCATLGLCFRLRLRNLAQTPWTRSQIRPAAIFALLKLLTGFTLA